MNNDYKIQQSQSSVVCCCCCCCCGGVSQLSNNGLNCDLNLFITEVLLDANDIIIGYESTLFGFWNCWNTPILLNTRRCPPGVGDEVEPSFADPIVQLEASK